MEKEYGASILGPAPAESHPIEVVKEAVDAVVGEKELKVDPKDIEEMKKESTKRLDKVIVDPLTGIRAASETVAENRKFSEIINEREQMGKAMTVAGRSILKQLLGRDPDSELIDRLGDYFRKIENIHSIEVQDVKTINSVLGEEICQIIQKKIFEKDSYEDIVRNLLKQLYSSYLNIIQYNDDVSTLSRALSSLKDLGDSIDSSSVKTLKDAQDKLMQALSLINGVDTTKYRNSYSIDDMDIRIMSEIKECLDIALSFKSVYHKVDEMGKKYKKDLKNRERVQNTILNWVTDLRSDPDTLYSFPVELTNISDSKLYESLVEYVVKIIAYEKLSQYMVEEDTVDLLEYYQEKGYLSKKDLKLYENQAIAILYVLSKTFKYKNIVSTNDRRILSYTLDTVSKCVVRDTRKDFVKLIDYVWEKVSNPTYI